MCSTPSAELQKTPRPNIGYELRLAARRSAGHPDYQNLCRKFVAIEEASILCDDKLRATARKLLPPFSETLVPAAERIVSECGVDLREKLYDLLIEELSRKYPALTSQALTGAAR